MDRAVAAREDKFVDFARFQDFAVDVLALVDALEKSIEVAFAFAEQISVEILEGVLRTALCENLQCAGL